MNSINLLFSCEVIVFFFFFFFFNSKHCLLDYLPKLHGLHGHCFIPANWYQSKLPELVPYGPYSIRAIKKSLLPLIFYQSKICVELWPKCKSAEILFYF